MLIYSPDKSPRLKYVLDFIFRDVYKIDYRISKVKEEVISHNGPKINYSNELIEGVPSIHTVPLLFEESVSDQIAEIKPGTHWKSNPVIFPVENNSIIPFDIFAAVFYFISRYEEYLPFNSDRHGRFHSASSIANVLKADDLPLVDHWLLNFSELLNKTFGYNLDLRNGFFFEPTIEIDNAWAFKNKGLVRTIGSVL